MIVQHGVKCRRCSEDIFSNYRHDFVSCKCGATFIDGGSTTTEAASCRRSGRISPSRERSRRDPGKDIGMPDEDGYPTEEELDTIKNWPIVLNSDCERLMDYIEPLWSYPQYWHRSARRTRKWKGSSLIREYEISTGGWSGNETIVEAMEANLVFNMICAWSWRRGGHYVFHIPSDAT